MARPALRCALTLLLASTALSQVQYDAARKQFLLQTATSSYAMGVDANGLLRHLYWGAPLWRPEDLPQPAARRDISSFDPREMLENEEYPGWGGPRYYEPALKITRDDGNRDLVLAYVSHTSSENNLDVVLKDIRDDIRVVLHYRVYPEHGILRRSATIFNGTTRPFTIESAQSAVFPVPPGDEYRLTYLTGRWAAETQIRREPIHEGMEIIESRKGHTSHYYNPWFAIDDGSASEEHGPVWYGALAWSGNWRITIEQTAYKQVRVIGGYNSFDFSYPLKPGEKFDTPDFYAGFSSDGFGGASRQLHRFERDDISPGGARSRARPVLYNSWEATEFDVNEAGQKALAEKAAKIGVELFVIDDGWFGKRNNDKAGLGDWVVNRQKFPQGLKPLIAYVNSLGMDFGLWVEPEMVNPDSDLYRAHPDWVINFPGRPRSELRNQLVLNLARKDVSDYIFNSLDRLASEYNIRYFKWDMNRSFSEPGWPEVTPLDQRKLWVEYVRNLYDILDRLRARHPQLEIEGCSGGGGRIDLGILRRVDEVWASDDTDAFDRLFIQEGFSMAHAPKLMSAWVTDVPNMNSRSTPLQFRFLVAMQGALGIGANLNKWSAEDFGLATKMVSLYKDIRNTVQTGALYRLSSPDTNDVTANEYVSADGRQAVLFAFRVGQHFNTPAPAQRLRGLEHRGVYRVRSIDGKLNDIEVSGAYLGNVGLELRLRGDFDSTAVVIDRIK